jgi:formylglycine-generating enzyme required for sulfatase activity
MEWSAAAGLESEIGPTPKEKGEQGGAGDPWAPDLPPSRWGNFADFRMKQKYPGWLWANPAVDDGYSETSPVGSFPPNDYGLFDLSGNVWEWCEDMFDGSEGSRVMRGGAWDSQPLPASARGCGTPGERKAKHGFRVVLAFDESPPP